MTPDRKNPLPCRVFRLGIVDYEKALILQNRLAEARGPGGGVLRNISLGQTIGVRGESTYEPAWKGYARLPSALQRDSTTVFGTTPIRQDWSLL